MNSPLVHDPLKSNPCRRQKGETARSGATRLWVLFHLDTLSEFYYQTGLRQVK